MAVVDCRQLIEWLRVQRNEVLVCVEDSKRAGDHQQAECYDYKAAGFQAVIDKLSEGE